MQRRIVRRRGGLAAAAVVLGTWTGTAATEPVVIEEGDLAALQARILQERGHPLLVNFWATWCVPCLQEMPLLNRLQEDLQPHARVLAVSLDAFVYPDREDAREKVGLTVRREGLQVPVFLYLGGQESVEQVYSLPGGLPHTLLVAPDGTIVDRVEGRLEAGEVDRLRRRIGEMTGAAEP